MPRSAIRRFRATIRQKGVNPFVDVPQALSRAFAEHARAGRIAVQGKLNQVPIQAVLVPVKNAGHRLFVNGGMRASAGVSVGDTVRFSLRAADPHKVAVAADLASALNKKKGARSAFDALALSYRRQLLRYVEDARTPEGRRKRILKTVEHVLGKPTPAASRGRPSRPLWTCPRCGNEFVNRNQFHSCKRYEISDVLAGKPQHIQDLFARFRAMVESSGPVKTLAYRDHIGFMVRVRFAGAFPKRDWLDVGFWLPRRVDDPRFHHVETIYPNAHVHRVRITELSQLDSQIQGWLKEAYAVGRQEHLK